MEDNKNKKKRFKFFDLQKEGKGVSKNSKTLEPGLKRFFISYKNNFGKLVSTNIFFILGNFPAIFLIAALAGVSQNTVFLPLSDLFQNINGIFQAEGSLTPYKMAVFAIEGLQSSSYTPTALTYVFYAIGALTLVTFGLVNVGTAYIIRNMVSGEPVFVWHDFWYAVKRNWKQALPFGIIDAIASFILAYNLYSLITTTGNIFMSIMFWSTVAIFIFYFFMRYYMYVQMVTFNLSVFKILKNSLIFSLLGFKRNAVAFLGIVAGLLIELMCVIGVGGILLPFGIALPFLILFSSFAYMKVYAAYFKIKEIMIDPYLKEHPEEVTPEYDDEIIMTDDVTERERLEEIKKRNSI